MEDLSTILWVVSTKVTILYTETHGLSVLAKDVVARVDLAVFRWDNGRATDGLDKSIPRHTIRVQSRQRVTKRLIGTSDFVVLEVQTKRSATFARALPILQQSPTARLR